VAAQSCEHNPQSSSIAWKFVAAGTTHKAAALPGSRPRTGTRVAEEVGGQLAGHYRSQSLQQVNLQAGEGGIMKREAQAALAVLQMGGEL
jgi:hypothetical protein